MIKLETKHAFLKENVKDYQSVVDGLHQQLMNKECKGNDYVDVYKRQDLRCRLFIWGNVTNS